tara:strand:+ start:2467 stop:2703 length:237 start_codon:yes stop_codon:yes gene_type:complete
LALQTQGHAFFFRIRLGLDKGNGAGCQHGLQVAKMLLGGNAAQPALVDHAIGDGQGFVIGLFFPVSLSLSSFFQCAFF